MAIVLSYRAIPYSIYFRGTITMPLLRATEDPSSQSKDLHWSLFRNSRRSWRIQAPAPSLGSPLPHNEEGTLFLMFSLKKETQTQKGQMALLGNREAKGFNNLRLPLYNGLNVT